MGYKMEDEMYSIRDISDRFDIPASTIRYYEEIGLLENVEHKDGYHRIFNESHIERLSAIDCFKKSGLPLTEIKQFFEYERNIKENSGSILEMMKQQEQKTLAKIEDLETGLANVRRKIKYYSAVDSAIKDGKEIPKWKDVIG